MPLPAFCQNEIGMELMRRARAEPDEPFHRMVLADWLERLADDDALEMCRVLRASFEGHEIIPLEPEVAGRLAPMIGARRGWFSGSWLGRGEELEQLWLASACTEELPDGVPLEMEYIPAGTFMMGSPESQEERSDDEKLHPVTISKPFYLGKYPVTQAQMRAVMGVNPSQSKGDNLPVEQVSWDDCQEFLKKLNQNAKNVTFRLPTEAEWEYACRAGSTSAYGYGNNPDSLGDYAWYEDNSGNTTHQVGQKKPNAWGLYDMHGNVWEWCNDWYGDYATGAISDPTGPQKGSRRVYRGGGWSGPAGFCRSADRGGVIPGNRYSNLGFRVSAGPS